MTKSAAQRFINRKRLLDAVRGLYKPSSSGVSKWNNNEGSLVNSNNNSSNNNNNNKTNGPTTSPHRGPLRCFPLQKEHVQDAFVANTPEKFHSLLCQKIRQAKKRVLLASLYVGPAATPQTAPKEQELLEALQEAASKPHVQVDLLLDKNRALRKIPLASSSNNTNNIMDNSTSNSTSSAEAVHRALSIPLVPLQSAANKHDEATTETEPHEEDDKKNTLFLCSVLPASLQYFLPNPYNEVAGVFHIKVYIVDNSLILSGANLSEEYFVDRHDRYIHITNGGGGLVDFYHDLIRTLCDHSEVYQQPSSSQTNQFSREMTTRTQLIEALNKLLTVRGSQQRDNDDLDKLLSDPNSNSSDSSSNNKTVAVVVPTFQAPDSYFAQSNTPRNFPIDTEVTNALLQAASTENPSASIVRISSAYLNPTDSLLKVLADIETIEFLTAGRISHGFAPKKKAGNKGKDWIPSVFLTISKEACQHLDAAKLLYYERPKWTFHAKGLWLEERQQQQQDTSSSNGTTNDSSTSLAAAICGSGNYGARSETLDMESNCVFILPHDSSSQLSQGFQKEWKDMMTYTNHQPPLLSAPSSSTDEAASTPASLSWPLQVFLPIIRKFL